jgi:WD40 repeat protein
VTRNHEDGYLYFSDTYDPGKDPIFLRAERDCDRVMFSPDGRWLASGCNNVVRVWDVQDIEDQHFPFYFGSPAAFSPDATRLAIISDGTIRILDLQGNRTERVINLYGQRYQLHNLRFSPDNLWIAATDAVGTIFLWDLTSDALITLNGLGGSERAVSDIAFTADSRQLISVSDDGITRKWDLLNPYAASLRVQLKEIYNIDSLSFSSDGRWLAINGWHKHNGDSFGGTLLDLKNWPGDPITLPTSSGALFFSPNGDQVISVNEKDNKIRRWDVADIAEGNFIPNSTDVPGKIIFNVQDNHWLISQLEDNTLRYRICSSLT